MRAGGPAFIGQYAEVSDDVVFTVEYSVRTVWAAVAGLLKLDKRAARRLQGTTPSPGAGPSPAVMVPLRSWPAGAAFFGAQSGVAAQR